MRFVLTLQTEPLAGKVYAAGFLCFGSDLYGSGSRVEVLVAARATDCECVRREFIRALHAEMLAVDRHNAAPDSDLPSRP